MGDEDPLSLLIADVSIDCQTDEYWAMFFFACLMVLVYPIGTPMCLLFMLFKHRKVGHHLHHPRHLTHTSHTPLRTKV